MKSKNFRNENSTINPKNVLTRNSELINNYYYNYNIYNIYIIIIIL